MLCPNCKSEDYISVSYHAGEGHTFQCLDCNHYFNEEGEAMALPIGTRPEKEPTNPAGNPAKSEQMTVGVAKRMVETQGKKIVQKEPLMALQMPFDFDVTT